MATRHVVSSEAGGWRELYRAALFESDRSKVPKRINDAKRALVQRARELFLAEGDHIEEEQALDDAMYALHALESICWERGQGEYQDSDWAA